MNRVIEARCFVVSAWNVINEKGLGQSRLINQHIRSARTLLSGASEDYVGVDWCRLELAAAIGYVLAGSPVDALKSLKWVEDVLGVMLDEKEPPSAVVERLLRSEDPWKGYRDRS